MGTWFHGWIETRNEFQASWSPLLKTDELLGVKSWWRIPLFGHSRHLSGYFDPLPFVDGVPNDVSETVAFDVAGPNNDRDSQLESLNDYFYDPEDEAQYITYDELNAIDWDEPRNDMLADLRELDDELLEPELVMHAFRFELRDDEDTVVDSREYDLSREAKLAAIERTTDCDPAIIERCSTNVPETLRAESGPVELSDGLLYTVRPTRRDFLPPNWFTVIDLMAEYKEPDAPFETEARLFSYFS